MNKPKVLVFIDWYLPGTKAGGPVRSCANLVDHLSDRIEFSIVTTDTDYTENEPYPDVMSDQWVPLKGGSRVWYSSKEELGSSTLERVIQEQDYDAYYINGMYSKHFSILPLRALKEKKRDKKVVVAVRGMLAEGAMKFGAMKKRSFLQLAKWSGLYKNVTFQATNDQEAKDIRTHLGKNVSVEVIANLPRAVKPVNVSIEKVTGDIRILCLARIAVEKNTLYAIEQMSRLKGNIQLDLCGTVYDEGYWAECKDRIDELPQHVSVSHLNGVDGSEVPELLRQYHVMLLPSLGENFGHVIFESLSAGRPVIISDRTPWQDLQKEKAGFVLPLSDPEEFSNSLQLFSDMDQQEYDEWSNAAFEYALRYLEQDKTSEQYLELFTG